MLPTCAQGFMPAHTDVTALVSEQDINYLLKQKSNFELVFTVFLCLYGWLRTGARV